MARKDRARSKGLEQQQWKSGEGVLKNLSNSDAHFSNEPWAAQGEILSAAVEVLKFGQHLLGRCGGSDKGAPYTVQLPYSTL